MIRILKINRANINKAVDRIRSKTKISDEVTSRVSSILREVREEGDEALIRLTKVLDGVELSREELIMHEEDMRRAVKRVSPSLVRAMKRLHRNIKLVEQRRLSRLNYVVRFGEGLVVRAVWRPLDSVGCYVPGGRASYPSTVMMTGVPGSMAGVSRLVMATPPRRIKMQSDIILAAAYIAGFDEVVQVGGAQAIAALAYGTESIKPVKKIVGPGNIYVVAAKNMVYPYVDVDFPAGPTELLAVFDKTSDLRLLVADMLAQAEHSPDTLIGAASMEASALRLLRERLLDALRGLPEDSAARRSISENCFLALVEDATTLTTFINALAPEHVSISCKEGRKIIDEIKNAGVITTGEGIPSVMVDYFAGPSHVLPTGGYADRFSSLSVLDYVRVMHIVYGSRRAARAALRGVQRLVESEGLPNHLSALRIAAGD